jgi:hypothetical protein
MNIEDLNKKIYPIYIEKKIQKDYINLIKQIEALNNHNKAYKIFTKENIQKKSV